MLKHTSDTEANGVRRVGNSLNHYRDLERSPIHLRPLLDSATFLKNYIAREANEKILSGEGKGPPMAFGEREEWEEIHSIAMMSLGAENQTISIFWLVTKEENIRKVFCDFAI